MVENAEGEAFKAYRKDPSPGRLSELLALHQGRAFNICFQLLHRREDAEDAALEALVKIIGDLPRIKTPHAFRHWLYRVCLTQALNLRRQNRRRQIRELRYAMLSVPSESPPERFRDDERASLFQALERLDEEDRSLLVEHYFEKAPLEQIARRDGVSSGLIWKKIERARRTLRQTLTAMGAAAAIPDPTLILEACQPIALTTNLVPGALANAAAASVMATTITGGTVMATKGAFAGMTVVIATVALCVGGSAGFLARRSDASPERIRQLEDRLAATSRELERARSSPGGASRMAGSKADSPDKRVAELEAQVRELRKANEESLRRGQEPKEKGPSDKDSKADQPLPLPADFDIDKLADLLDLDSGRKAQLKRHYDSTQAKIHQLESELAKVDSTNDRIRIEIPSFGERGRQLKDEWDLNLSYVLTAAEREKYSKHQLGRTFFDSERAFGEAARTLDLIREDQRARVIESWREKELTNEYVRGYASYEDGAASFKSRFAHVLR